MGDEEDDDAGEDGDSDGEEDVVFEEDETTP